MRKILLITIILLAAAGTTRAYDKLPAASRDTADPLIDLIRICEGNYTGGGLFDYFINVFEDRDSVVVTKNTDCNMEYYYGRYKRVEDSVITVQDSLFLVTVYLRDSTILVEKPQPFYRALFDIDIFDPAIYESHVSGIQSSDSADCRKITLNFKNESPYIRYVVTYDTVLYRIRNLNYQLKKEFVPATAGVYTPLKYTSVYRRYWFTWYINMYPGLVPFPTQSYVARKNGVLVGVGDYKDFYIIDANNTTQLP